MEVCETLEWSPRAVRGQSPPRTRGGKGRRGILVSARFVLTSYLGGGGCTCPPPLALHGRHRICWVGGCSLVTAPVEGSWETWRSSSSDAKHLIAASDARRKASAEQGAEERGDLNTKPSHCTRALVGVFAPSLPHSPHSQAAHDISPEAITQAETAAPMTAPHRHMEPAPPGPLAHQVTPLLPPSTSCA